MSLQLTLKHSRASLSSDSASTTISNISTGSASSGDTDPIRPDAKDEAATSCVLPKTTASLRQEPPAFDLEVDRSLVKASSSLKAWSDPGAAVQMVTPPVLERVSTLWCLLRILRDAMRMVRAASSDDELDV